MLLKQTLIDTLAFNQGNTCADDIVKDVGYIGYNIKETLGELKVESAEECREECKKEEECAGWMWFSPSFSFPGRHKQCWLKSKMNKKESKPGVYTGHCTGILKYKLDLLRRGRIHVVIQNYN